MKKRILISGIVTFVIVLLCAGLWLLKPQKDASGVTTESCMKIYENLSNEIQQIEEKYLDEDGYVIDELENDLMEDVYEYAKNLLSKNQITSTAYNPNDGDSCVYMEIANWVDVVYVPPKKDVMSGGESECDVEVFVFEPNATEMRLYIRLFAVTSTIPSYKYPTGDADIITEKFPLFSCSNKYKDKEVTLESLQTIQPNSVILWEGHGGYTEEIGSFLMIGTKKHDSTIIRDHWKEYGDKALCMNTKGQFYITSKYIENYMPDDCFDGSLIYLASCYSMKSDSNNQLINSIWNKGARAVLGSTDEIGVFYNIHMMDAFVEGLCSRNDAGNYRTVTQALKYAKKKYGEIDFWGPKGATITMKFRDGDDFTLEDMSSKINADSDGCNNTTNIQEGLYIVPNTQNILYVEQDEEEISFTAWWFKLFAIEETAVLKGSDAEFVDERTRQISGKLHFDTAKAILTLDENRVPYLDERTEYSWLRESLWELSGEQLKEIGQALRVPANLNVEYIQDKAYYWEADGLYVTYVQIFYNNEVIATATVDSFTGELIKDILMYSNSSNATESRSIDTLSQLLNDYFAVYQWENEDIISGEVFNGFWLNDTEALFELRVQTKSAEWTNQANILVGTVSIDAKNLTGYIEWNGGNKVDIKLEVKAGG